MVNNIGAINSSNSLQQIQNSSIPENHETILQLFKAGKKNESEALFLKLWNKPPTERPAFFDDPKAMTSLLFAFIDAQLYIRVATIVDHAKLDLTMENDDNKTPLMAVAEAGYETEVVKLIAQGAQPYEKKEAQGASALSYIIQKCSPRFLSQICDEWFTEENMRSENALKMLVELFMEGSCDLGIRYFRMCVTLNPKPQWATEKNKWISALFCAVCTGYRASFFHDSIKNRLRCHDQMTQEMLSIMREIAPYVDPDQQHEESDDDNNPMRYVVELAMSDIIEVFNRNNAHWGYWVQGAHDSLFSWIVNDDDLGYEFARDLLKVRDLTQDCSQLLIAVIDEDEKLALWFCRRIEKENPDWWNKKGLKEYCLERALQNSMPRISSYLLARVDLKQIPESVTIEALDVDRGIIQEQWPIASLVHAALTGQKKHNMKAVIKRLFAGGLDFVKGSSRLFQCFDDDVVIFEKIALLFQDDWTFVHAVMAQCTTEWMRRYINIFELICTKKMNEALQELQREFNKKEVDTWTQDTEKLMVLLKKASELNQGAIACCIADKMIGTCSYLQGLDGYSWSDDEKILIIAHMTLDEKQTIAMLRHYVERDQKQFVDAILGRLAPTAKQQPAWARKDETKSAIIALLLRSKKFAAEILQVVSLYNLLFLKFDDNKSILQKILEIYGSSFLLRVIQTVSMGSSLDDAVSTCHLFRSLISLGQIPCAQALFKRLMTPGSAPIWMRNPREYASIFWVVVSNGQHAMADAMIDGLDVTLRNMVSGVSMLMLVAKQPKSSEMKALIEKLLKRNASLLDIDRTKRSAFSYVHALYPEITTQFIETCSLDQDRSSLFELLIREKFHELAMLLFGRIQSFTEPLRWWTGKARAELFFVASDYIQSNDRAREIVDSLLRDDALDVCAENDQWCNVLRKAIDTRLEKSVIDTLLRKGGKKALLQFHKTNGISTFVPFCRYQDDALCTHNEVKELCADIGVTVTPNMTYIQLLSHVKEAMYRNETPRRSRVLIGVLLGQREWLCQYVNPCSFTEKVEYVEAVCSKLSKNYADFLLDCIFSIDAKHLAGSIMPKTMPEPSAPITIDVLAELCSQYENKAIPKEKIRAFIDRIKQKKKDVATPSSSKALELFYKTIEDQVLLVLDYFRNKFGTLDATSIKTPKGQEVIKEFHSYCADCVIVTDYCGTRLQDHARSYYVQYILNKKYDFETKIQCELAEYRSTITESALTYDLQSVHAYNAFLKKYGKAFGIPGSEDEIEDKFIAGHEQQVELARRFFVSTYTPSNIIQFVQFILKDGNNRDRYIDFLKTLDSTPRTSLQCDMIDELVQKHFNENRQNIRDFFAGAPYYISLEDSDVVSQETLKKALEQKDNQDRLLFAKSEKGEGAQKEYTWIGVALLLLQLQVLKV